MRLLCLRSIQTDCSEVKGGIFNPPFCGILKLCIYFPDNRGYSVFRKMYTDVRKRKENGSMTEFEEKLGYTFKNKKLLETALTHSSYANEKRKRSNERLEFLGDSVLSLIVSSYIFKKLNNVNEGELTKIRASLVCEQALAEFSKNISLNEYILLGKGEEMSGGRKRASIISDAFEAVLAAIYLDGGINEATKWVMNVMKDKLSEALTGKNYKDYKTMLQEAVQHGDCGKVTYNTIKETGPDHNKYFEVEVLIDGKVENMGVGASKKEAEQDAAKKAFDKIKGKE